MPAPSLREIEFTPIETGRLLIRVAGQLVELTQREFALLEYLIRHAGRAVSKTELLDHVWDNAADVAPNAVEVYVGYLRRKITDLPLVTVRGAGYRLVT